MAARALAVAGLAAVAYLAFLNPEDPRPVSAIAIENGGELRNPPPDRPEAVDTPTGSQYADAVARIRGLLGETDR